MGQDIKIFSEGDSSPISNVDVTITSDELIVWQEKELSRLRKENKQLLSENKTLRVNYAHSKGVILLYETILERFKK